MPIVTTTVKTAAAEHNVFLKVHRTLTSARYTFPWLTSLDGTSTATGVTVSAKATAAAKAFVRYGCGKRGVTDDSKADYEYHLHLD